MTTSEQELINRLWQGKAQMEEWTASVSGGARIQIGDDIIAVSTGYLYGNVTAIRCAP